MIELSINSAGLAISNLQAMIARSAIICVWIPELDTYNSFDLLLGAEPLNQRLFLACGFSNVAGIRP